MRWGMQQSASFFLIFIAAGDISLQPYDMRRVREKHNKEGCRR